MGGRAPRPLARGALPIQGCVVMKRCGIGYSWGCFRRGPAPARPRAHICQTCIWLTPGRPSVPAHGGCPRIFQLSGPGSKAIAQFRFAPYETRGVWGRHVHTGGREHTRAAAGPHHPATYSGHPILNRPDSAFHPRGINSDQMMFGHSEPSDRKYIPRIGVTIRVQCGCKLSTSKINSV